MYDELLTLLLSLDGVQQHRKFHPEGDALYHSLQVFESARRDTEDWELLAAALLHDVGKGVEDEDHASLGAALLSPFLPERVCWLVEHHLDLLREPARTRARLQGSAELRDLQHLRRWDLAGRKKKVWVPSPEDALADLLNLRSHSLRAEPPQG